ncbi:MAG: hypothetical protein H7Y86_06850 [Rhizobacter sp.]|nr:hypothetical protein [Ferruginibacter sp.]
MIIRILSILRSYEIMKARCLFLFLFLSSVVFAQTANFASDRPGLSNVPDLIEKKSWQIATGFDISKYNHSGNYQPSENTLKYGISKRFEARLDFGMQYNHSAKIYGASGPSFGMKALLFNQHKAFPKTALIIEYYPPPFSTTQQFSGLATEFCFSHTFKNGNNLYYNGGANWQDIYQTAILNSLIGFSCVANAKLNSFIEFYLYKAPLMQINYVSDIGITYQLNKQLQIDFSAGLNVVQPQGNYYYSGGFTYNF